MSKIWNFYKRNLKEILRDPIIYIFGLGFPIIMLILFQIINHYAGENTPMFKLDSLLPAIIMFSYSFIMIVMALLVSKDRQTSFLKRLYSSPMKSYHFILGYFIVGFLLGICQTIICIITGLIIALVSSIEFLSFAEIVLLIISQLPILITSVFLGILFGTIFNDKSAPGICSVLISISGILGGCWMPVETMGSFEIFCRFLPYYPSVYIGRTTTGATTAMGVSYSFNTIAVVGLITILIYMTLSIVSSVLIFRKNMVSDK